MQSQTIGCVIVSTLKPSVLKHLNKAIESVKRSAKNTNQSCFIVVVSNHNSKFPITISAPYLFIPVDQSTGFGAMNNKGIKALLDLNCPLSHILLLNDDAHIHSQFLKILENENIKNQNEVDVFIPIICDPITKNINSYGMEIFQSGFACDAANERTSTVWGTAACIIFSTKFIRKVVDRFGMFFNEQLYFYYEDVELAYRALSLRPYVVKSNQLKAFHVKSLTSGLSSDFTVFYTLQSYLWIVIMNWPSKMLFIHGWKFFLVYTWLLFRLCVEKGPRLILSLFISTSNNYNKLITSRRMIIDSYSPDYNPVNFFIPKLFRTRKEGIII